MCDETKPRIDGEEMTAMAMAAATHPSARSVIEAHIRELRERADDLQKLLDGLPAKLVPEADRALCGLVWRGNVR